MMNGKDWQPLCVLVLLVMSSVNRGRKLWGNKGMINNKIILTESLCVNCIYKKISFEICLIVAGVHFRPFSNSFTLKWCNDV